MRRETPGCGTIRTESSGLGMGTLGVIEFENIRLARVSYFFIEPGHGLSKKATARLRLGGDNPVGDTTKSDGKEVTRGGVSVFGVGSYPAIGDYYFSNNTICSYAGLDLEFYSEVTVSFSNSSTSVGLKRLNPSALDAMPRLGVNVGYFKMILAHNFPLSKRIYKPF